MNDNYIFKLFKYKTSFNKKEEESTNFFKRLFQF
jgi:hypothetical protein